MQALTETGADKKLKRVILVNGAKQYGVHLGPSKVPCEESDPRVEGPGRPPNFYYNQQNILAELSEGKTWDWVRSLRIHNHQILCIITVLRTGRNTSGRCDRFRKR